MIRILSPSGTVCAIFPITFANLLSGTAVNPRKVSSGLNSKVYSNVSLSNSGSKVPEPGTKLLK